MTDFKNDLMRNYNIGAQMKKMRNLIRGAMTAAAMLASVASAQATVWTTWTSGFDGTPGGAFGDMGGIFAIYSGDLVSVDANYPSWTPASTWTSPGVTPPPQSGGILHTVGGTDTLNFIFFGAPITNPLLAVWSLGAPNTPTTFDFGVAGPQPFTILSSGQNAEYTLPSNLSQSGSILTGTEGSGVIQFIGTYNMLTWTNPQYENWFGFTVGMQTAVPEPSTWAMIVLGFAGVGLLAYRRSRKDQGLTLAA